MSKLIVIVGITGNQGGSVAQVFLNEPGWKVRGITRNPDPSRPANKSLLDGGAELVAANLDDEASLVQAFAGANAIYGVTDFWQFPRDPETQKAATSQKITINEASYNRELHHAKTLIDAVAMTGPTLERFVFSTLSDSKKWSNGEITWNYHFDGKAEATKYLKATYPELASKTSYLQVGFYMTNWKSSPFLSPRKQADGNYLIRAPSCPNPKPVPFVHPPNDTGPFVHALVAAPAETTMLGFSTKASMVEFCNLWTRVMRERGLIGQDVVCRFDGSMTVDECDKRLPGGLGREIGESCVYSAKWGFDGSDPEVKEPREVGVQLDKLLSLEEFIRNEDWTPIL